MAEFPADFPPDCPPTDAEDAGGKVYRLAWNTPPSGKDIETMADQGKARDGCPCQRCGLSVFRERDDALHQAQLFKYLGDRIAAGILVPAHGKTRLSQGRQPTHTTWWPYSGVDRASVFTEVEPLPQTVTANEAEARRSRGGGR